MADLKKLRLGSETLCEIFVNTFQGANLIKLVSYKDDFKFIIEDESPDIGFYLYVYRDNKCITDYLQDTLEFVKEEALEKYNIPLNSWEILQ